MVKIEDTTFSKIQKQTDKFNSTEKEGWVIYVDGMKYKFKCDDYVKVHEILDKRASKNIIIRAVIEGTIDDIIAKVPSAYRQEILDDVEVINNYVKEQMDEIYFYYNQVKDIESDKEFAITCKKLGFPKKITGRVLALRKGQEINILRSRSGKYIKSYKIFKEV